MSSAGVYGDGSPEETHLQDLLTVRQLLEAVHGRIPPRFHEGHTLRPVSVCGNTKVWGKEQTRVVLGQVGVSLYTEAEDHVRWWCCPPVTFFVAPQWGLRPSGPA
ncbi:hypothetical protein [Streptomyces sp. NPDC087297]|uniref:hypothetical protein n=1 Tax=Streptomyces sp. NPDC087297 TaxID=3365778 RepID=UPI00381B614D